MSTLIALLFLGIGAILAVVNPLAYVTMFSLVGASDISFGIVNYLNEGFRYYQFFMECLLLLSLLVILSRSGFSFKKNDYAGQLCVLLIIWILGASLIGIFKTGANPVTIFIYSIASYSPIYLLFFLLLGKDRNVEKYFSVFLGFHVILAVLVIYLPIFGIHVLKPIASLDYLSKTFAYAERYFGNPPALLSNWWMVFQDKYLFNQLAHFHNSNDTGFVGATAAFYFLYKAVTVPKHRVPHFLIGILGGVLWINSGMRGPILGIFAGILLWILMRDTSRKRMLVAVSFVILAVIFFEPLVTMIYDIVTSPSISHSFDTRREIRSNGLRFILENPILGNCGVISGLSEKTIDPHELPLRMTVLFGISGGLMILLLVYALPVKAVFLKQRNLMQYVFMMIAFAVSLTNNYTDISLFYFMLYLAVFSPDHSSEVNKHEKSTIHRKIRLS